MKILLVKPMCKPEVAEITGNLHSMQEIVGGTIQAIYPFEDPEAVLICNDDGKLIGLPLNRCLRDSEGKVYDVIAGTFFICRAPVGSDRFESLTEEQVEQYTEVFCELECFILIDGELFVIETN